MSSRRAAVSWSGGKDCAFALQEAKGFEPVSLLTTLTRDFNRISMHGVRQTLLDRQAEMLGIPLRKVWIGKGATNSEYDSQVSAALAKYHAEGVQHIIYGDLFLEDIRRYREERLAAAGMTGVFPLWRRDTKALASAFIKDGYRAIVCTVDPRALDGRFCGRDFDDSFISDLPASVDPCGENGEFHTFVYAGPTFEREIPVRRGDIVRRDGFYFADILLA